MGDHSWGAPGSKFSFGFLMQNISANGIYYLDNAAFPRLFTALFFIGLFGFRKLLKWKLLILTWFLMFWGLFLFFYAGSYGYGADDRFSLLSFMPLSIIAGMGGGWIRDKVRARGSNDVVTGLIILTMLFSFLKFFPFVCREGQEAWGARYDHQYAKMFITMVPERSLILSQNPTMFLLWGRNAIQTYAGVKNPGLIKVLIKKYDGHVYFHYNYWCNTQNERNLKLCRDIREIYRLKEIVTAKEQDYEYGLYQMSLR